MGGWFFGGRKLSGDLARQTRYEVISYLTALENCLLIQWPSGLEETWRITEILEENIFSILLAEERPRYEIYKKRFLYRHPHDSDSLSHEDLIHVLFTQRVQALWTQETGWTSQSSEVMTTFSSNFIEVTNAAEGALRAGLEGVWPKHQNS